MNASVPAAAAGEITIGGDLTVRRLGYGAMWLTGAGVWGEPSDPDEARRVLRRAVELGVNLIDTADAYGPEVSERLIAEALHPYPDDLVIATKAGVTRAHRRDWGRDGSPEHLREACEASLRRLRLDRIDLYQLHAPDPDVPLEESMEAMAELKREGKVRHVGVSNMTPSQLERARAVTAIVSVQNEYSLSDRSSDPVLETCERDGLAFLPWGPLGQGDVLTLGGELERVAQAVGATPAQVAIAWLLARSQAMLPIPGTSSVEHLEENVAAAGLALGERAAALDAITARN